MNVAMAEKTPLYLVEPDTTGYTYGALTYNQALDSYEITAEPAVLEMAKRVFPGSRTWTQGAIRFPATRRAVGDLNWLMLRYPLRIGCPEKFADGRAKAIEHAARRDSKLVLAPATPPPTFQGELYPFQAEGVAFLAANERALLADDMGLGKTVTALAGLATVAGFPAILVVPNNVRLQWQRMAGRFLDLPTAGQATFDLTTEDRGKRLCHIITGRKTYNLPDRPVYIIPYHLLDAWRDALLDVGAKALVFDEVQELRHDDTKKYSAASLLAGTVTYVWGLSGTPIYNQGGEIWCVTNIMDYHCLGDQDSFRREWGTAYNSDIIEKPDVLGDYLRREGLMIRRRKSDVQTELPPKRRAVIVVDHDDDKYAALVKKAVDLAKGYADIKDWHEKGLAKREIDTAARQACGIAKAPYAADFVRSLLEAGERVLLFAYHHAVHDILLDELRSYNPVSVTGRETQAEKDAAVSDFADGRSKVILLSLRSTAGLDRLQGRGTCVVFAELDWSPAIHSQCEDRLHRLGVDTSLESILCYYLVSDTGMDETMQEALGLKIGQFVGLMGDSGETEEDRALSAQAAERHMDRVIEKLKAMKS